MGLFDKKYCCACGKKLSFLGGKKLEDGNLCKDCSERLSPWFTERKHSTVNEILSQLDYRLANESDVAMFNPTRTIGENMKVYLDEPNGKFLVTGASNLAKANPDVLTRDMITNCTYKINESRTELKQDGPEGTKISYDPPRYEYRYDFYVTIDVDHPYFTQMRFRLNNSSVYVKPEVRTVKTTETTTTRPGVMPPRPRPTAGTPVPPQSSVPTPPPAVKPAANTPPVKPGPQPPQGNQYVVNTKPAGQGPKGLHHPVNIKPAAAQASGSNLQPSVQSTASADTLRSMPNATQVQGNGPVQPVRPVRPARPGVPGVHQPVVTSTVTEKVDYVVEYSPEENADYVRYKEMSEEICRVLWPAGGQS